MKEERKREKRPFFRRNAMPTSVLTREGREDSNLVRSCCQGDVEAFSSLVEKYQDSVYNIAYRMVADPEEASDVAQEAFLKAFEKLDTFKQGRSFRAWLFSISANTAIDHLRRGAGRRDIPMDVAFRIDTAEGWKSGTGFEPPAPNARNPEEESITGEVSRLVQEQIRLLPHNYRAVIVLHYLEGLSYGQVGKALGVPRNTAKTWSYRARCMLCDALEGVI